MLRFLAPILLAVVAATTATHAGTADDGLDREAVIGYLMQNPDVILEAIDRYEAARKVAIHAEALFGEQGDPFMGNPDGAVVLVEFSDYNCPYCQVMLPVLQRLLAEEPELKLIVKEMPILAETSWYAAQVALAAHEQGRFREFHETMFGVGARSEAIVDDIAELVGVDRDDDDLAATDARINANLALGQDLGLDGTPSFVIGDRIFIGQVSYEDLKAAIAAELAAR
ncbi:MAG: DsbA family protein [Alphaproteobacteria bacterium]